MVWKTKVVRKAYETCGCCANTNLDRINEEKFLKFDWKNLQCNLKKCPVNSDDWCEDWKLATELDMGHDD